MKYYEYELEHKNIKALTTTVECGNMAYQVGEDKDEVYRNREALYKELGLDRYHVVYVHQSHSDVIKEVFIDDGFKGGESFEEGIEADALYTKQRELALGIFHADCLPVIFYDPTVPLVGVIHSGFKGTLKHITQKALRKVIDKEHLNPSNIQIYIGPYRHPETFILEPEDFEKLMMAYLPIRQDGHMDLLDGIKFDLTCCFIPLENIHNVNIDTAKDERFFSAYKKDPVGRSVTMVYLK